MGFTSLGAVIGALLISWSIAAAADDQTYSTIPLRTHSLSQPFLDNELQSRWFDYGGDTVIRTDKYIRLASELPSQAGWIFSRVPLTATNWEIELEFQIHGKSTLHGDGMALFVTSQRGEQGGVFGFQDKFEGLGLFFDTYKNNRPGTVFPYVMAMVGDGNTQYDKDNDGKANELAGCSARGLRNPDFATKARITYIAEKSLKVELMYKAEDSWTDCFEVENVKLPAIAYVGLTAETGELSDNFDVIKLETKNLYQKTGSGGNDGSKIGDKSKKGRKTGSDGTSSSSDGGSWTWTFLKFIIFGLALVGVYVGFTVYRTSRKDRF